MQQTFFMNYMEGSSAPTVRYFSKEHAEKEAERLVRTHGRKVFTLITVSSTEPPQQYIKTEFFEIPAEPLPWDKV